MTFNIWVIHEKWVCFACRTTTNRPHAHCPTCGGTLENAGKYFKPPKRRNDKEWEAVQLLVRAGVTYDHDGFPKRPRHPRDVHTFLQRDDVRAHIAFMRAWREKREKA